MTSGKPLSAAEKKLIAQYPNEWPAVLARHLALHYAADNGGSRSAATVRRYQAELLQPPQIKPAKKRAAKPTAKPTAEQTEL